MNRLKNWRIKAVTLLSQSGLVIDPWMEVRIVLEELLSLPPQVAWVGDVDLSQDQVQILEKALRRRLSGCPLEYIVGRKVFAGYPFRMKKGVFIVRDVSEILIRHMLGYIQFWGLNAIHILDIGCGSGALGLALLMETKGSGLTGVDINPNAVSLFLENAQQLRVGNQVEGYVADASIWLWEQFPSWRWNTILMNPPYVPLWENVWPEVQFYEPFEAIWAPDAGLRILRQWLWAILAAGSKGVLPKPTLLGIEHHETHGPWVRNLLLSWGWQVYSVCDELGQISHIHTFGVYP